MHVGVDLEGICFHMFIGIFCGGGLGLGLGVLLSYVIIIIY